MTNHRLDDLSQGVAPLPRRIGAASLMLLLLLASTPGANAQAPQSGTQPAPRPPVSGPVQAPPPMLEDEEEEDEEPGEGCPYVPNTLELRV